MTNQAIFEIENTKEYQGEIILSIAQNPQNWYEIWLYNSTISTKKKDGIRVGRTYDSKEEADKGRDKIATIMGLKPVPVSSYIPRPWFATRSNNGNTLLVKPILGQIICEIYPSEEQEQNARLIAAAPELLECLKKMLIEFASHPVEFTEMDEKIMKMAEEVLVKAMYHPIHPLEL